MSHLWQVYVMTHIETRKRLRSIALVSDFEALLDLCTLSDEDKQILRLCYIQHKDFRYIGDIMGYAERTIKERHKAALQKISQAL